MNKKFNSETRFRCICLAILLLFTAICIAPFLLMFSASVTEEQALIRDGYKFWPETLSFDTYRYLWAKRETIFRAYMISVFVLSLIHIYEIYDAYQEQHGIFKGRTGAHRKLCGHADN